MPCVSAFLPFPRQPTLSYPSGHPKLSRGMPSQQDALAAEWAEPLPHPHLSRKEDTICKRALKEAAPAVSSSLQPH